MSINKVRTQCYYRNLVNSLKLSFRLIWICIILLAAGTFGLLIYNKAIYLRGNPKNVNLEVTYAPSMTFPAVTICNENHYRYVLAGEGVEVQR